MCTLILPEMVGKFLYIETGGGFYLGRLIGYSPTIVVLGTLFERQGLRG